MKGFGLIGLLLATAVPAWASMKPEHLKCEYLTNPICVDTAAPRLSWTIPAHSRSWRQSAYRVLVASSEGQLREGRADLWDSGQVSTDQCAQVAYTGAPLKSAQLCWWKVRVWDAAGKASDYSAPAKWEMGLLSPSEWHGKWIARTENKEYEPAPLLRREVNLQGKVKRARVYICGLGYYELRVNGTRVGTRTLDPGYTRFDRRDLYVAHDITGLLRDGANAFGVMLGTGWFNVHTKAVWYFDRAPWRNSPRAIIEIRVEFQDGRTETLSSDGSWRASTGPVVFDSIYGGETYDARLEKPGWDTPGYNDSAWAHAIEVPAPGGKLAAQPSPPIRAAQTIAPVKVTEPKPGVFVFDMGQNLAGRAELKVQGPAGTKVTMRYGEKIHADGSLDRSNIDMHMVKTDPPQRFQTDEYVLKGIGTETWRSRFTYHGFQYVEVTGFPGKPTLENLRAIVLHSDVPPVGEFECSNPLLNAIWKAGRWSYLSNLMGIPTDCPHREKNGWTGDAQIACELGLLNFDEAAVYTKWMNDLDDEQRPNGELPGIVPTSGWGYEWGNGPAWDSAFVIIPWTMYEYLGDTTVLARHYEGMKRYVDYVAGRSPKLIAEFGLGDWAPFETQTPFDLTSTGYFYEDTRIVARAAELLGKSDDARHYNELAGRIRDAFNGRYLNREAASYANGSQTALSCALYQGLAPDDVRSAVLGNLVKAVEKRDWHIDTGILGAKYLLRVLTDMGHADVAYRIASQRTLPSWGYWIDQGATTLWEAWRGDDSRNHIMYGDILAWFTRALAGLKPDETHPGWARAIVEPNVVGDLTSARASYDSIRGLYASEWRLHGGKLTLKVTVPANGSAEVRVPAAAGAVVTESGAPAETADGVRSLGRSGDRTVFEVGSGTYTFVVSAR